ncbi:MAG: hypothetical protein LBI49_22995 [Nocardiopsaceae bacterium]|jgi:hypothetical protein|nr:hypothetical protein [Nocardiopsaceae bacterium]
MSMPPAHPASTRTYLVHLPLAEARHLAGTAPTWPATGDSRLAARVREWVAGLSRRRTGFVPVRRVVADLTLILDTAPLPKRPLCGPFGPGRAGLTLPGRVEYLGDGVVRLDEAAIKALVTLADGDDFRVTLTAAGHLLTVGTDTYLAREEEPGAKPSALPPA